MMVGAVRRHWGIRTTETLPFPTIIHFFYNRHRLRREENAAEFLEDFFGIDSVSYRLLGNGHAEKCMGHTEIRF